ncbi:DoxX family protein, partial [Escherichia coli]|nr:DoxX family protein [Escherichia coli]
INMCVALFLVLGLSGWGAQELAAIYLLIYLTIFYTGPGKFSLDAWWLRRDCKVEVE